MRFRSVAVLAFLTLAGTGQLMAQNALAPIPKASERRAGELEDWTDKKPAAKAAPAKAAPARKTATVAKPKEKGASQTREPGDGGLPLPSSRTIDDGSPVGFDAKGNMGTSLRF